MSATGRQLRGWRQRAGWTREELAERSGVSERTIARLEASSAYRSRPSSLRMLAAALDLEPGEREQLLAPPADATDPSLAGLDGSVGSVGPVGEAVARVPAPAPAVIPDAAPSTPTPRQLPPSRTWFAGRAAELSALTSALTPAVAGPEDGVPTSGNAVLVSALAGSGGIGKTCLALHWAHEHLDLFPDGQLFVDLRGFSPDGSPLDPLAAVRGFLDALGVEPSRIRGGLAEHTACYRSRIAGRRMLVVLDNAADSEQVIPLLPGSPSCTVIVTSRKILTPLLTRHGAHHINLGVLTDSEAHALFVQHLGPARVAAEPEAVAELIRLCGLYPLALSIMAGRAHAHPDLPLADFATELREAGLQGLTDADPATSLPTVLSWSLRGLTAEQRAAFVLLGIAPGADIGLPAAASLTGLPMPRLRPVLRALVDASLLTRKPRDRYAMHDLIRDYAASLAYRVPGTGLEDGELDAARQRLIDFYLHSAHAAGLHLAPHRAPIELAEPPTGCHPESFATLDTALGWFETEQPNLMAAQDLAAERGWHAAVWQLAWAMTDFNDRQARFRDGLSTWRLGLDAANRLANPAMQSRAHRLLGRACAQVGHHAESIDHLHRALALAEEVGDAHDQAHTHYALILARAHQGDNEGALEHAAKVLSLYRAMRDPDPTWEADALNSAGWLHAQQGRYLQARDSCEAALAIYRRHGHPDGEASTLDSLGFIAHRLGEHTQALDHYERALTLRRTTGNVHREAATLEHIGDVHAALGHHGEARAVWRDALALYGEHDSTAAADGVRRKLAASA